MILTALAGILSLLFLIVRTGVLLWAYFRTRLTALLVYLVWEGLGGLVWPRVMKGIIDHYSQPGGNIVSQSDNVGKIISASSVAFGVIGTLLFAWMIVSLVRWALARPIAPPLPEPQEA